MFQNRLLENGNTPDIALEGAAGDVRGVAVLKQTVLDELELHGRVIAQGEVLPVATRSFGGIGVFAIPEMGRFYRHVLVGKHYPHHGAVAFRHCGKALFTVFQYLGVPDIAYNRPASLPYDTENPFC